MALTWKSNPIPRFEYEDDEFYCRVQEQYDHWEAVVYRKIKRRNGALLLTSELLDEDRSRDETAAKAFVTKVIERERKKT